jgi:hypothetical protein
MHTRTGRLLLLFVPLTFILVVSFACQSPKPAPPPEPPPYLPTSTIKDLMLSIVDPYADVVWNSVSTVHTRKGTVETMPRTADEWAAVRHGALTLAEGANLLMMPGRRVARPGEKSETPGIELEPEEMDVLIAKDRESWNKRATALHDAAVAILAAVDAKDPPKVFELGEKIEEACEGCHSQYWYPNQKPLTTEVTAPGR